MRIYSREEWGAKHPDGFGPAPVPVMSVWLHHTAGRSGTPGDSFEKDCELVRSIEATGQQRFGGGISYTFIVTRSGRVFEGHSIDRRGAHTKGLNTVGRAICFPGNYENNVPTMPQLEATAELLTYGVKQGWWARPRLTGGHRDAPGAQTACPGRNAHGAIGYINALAAIEGAEGLPIIAPNRTTLKDAQKWASKKDADLLFVDTIIPALWEAVEAQRDRNCGRGIDFATVVAQAAKETGWGRFGGVLDPSFRNTAGIKTAAGGDNFDPDAHQRFGSWAEGARAHLNHLAAYTGLAIVGDAHPRYHVVMRLPWAGTVTTVEELSTRWAPSSSYGRDIVRMVGELAAETNPAPQAVSTPPRPMPVRKPTLKRGSRGADVRTLQKKLGVRADGVFGPVTERAVREFQARQRLVVDGIVGPQTWSRLGG